MDVTVEFDYHLHNHVPPRCRKPRTVRRTGQVGVVVPEVTGAQAPVAFVVKEYEFQPADEYRWWGEQVWQPYKPWSRQDEPSAPLSKYFPAVQRGSVPYNADGLDAALRQLSWGPYLIIDGEVWEPTGEPRYEINTLGLGHNHSLTCLSIRNHFNGNIHRSRYFRADGFMDAIAEAVRVALARGDTKSVPTISDTKPIQVLIPEAVRCRPELEAGDGDPFLNKLYAISEGSSSSGEAGLLSLITLAREISQP